MILLSIHPILSKVLQLVASLSIIVIIHELGHFLPAKWFGCRVEKFYLFFDAWFSIFKKKIKGTEYGIGWIPLGGYVKISGMIDESLDKKNLQEEPKPWEFRSKKPWQKIIVMAGGVFMNLILGAFIFIFLAYSYGDEYIPNESLKYGLHFNQDLQNIGLQDGDIIVKVGDKEIDNYAIVVSEVVLNEAKNIIVFRNGEKLKLSIPNGFISSISQSSSKRKSLIEPRFPIIVDSVLLKNQFITKALLKGDKIISFNKIPISYFNELNVLKQHFKDSTVEIGVERDNKTEKILVKIDEQSNIGFMPKIPLEILQTKTVSYSLLQSIPVGISKAYATLCNYITGLRLLFTSKEVKVKDSLGGPISIGNMFPSDFSWQQFWILTAIISISIGIMNLLPIPALDGGHIIFGFYEWITGKTPSLKFQEYAQTAGMILLFGLMFYAIGLDLFRIFK